MDPLPERLGFGASLSLWWATMWRSALITVVSATGIILSAAPSYTAAAEFLLGVFALGSSLIGLHLALGKQYRSFGVAVEQRSPGTEKATLMAPESTTPRWAHTLRVWWRWQWRFAALQLAILFAARQIMLHARAGLSEAAGYAILLVSILVGSIVLFHFAVTSPYRSFRFVVLFSPAPIAGKRDLRWRAWATWIAHTEVGMQTSTFARGVRIRFTRMRYTLRRFFVRAWASVRPAARVGIVKPVGILALTMVVAIVLYQELYQERLVIDVLGMPKSLSEAGYTAPIISERLKDRIMEIFRIASGDRMPDTSDEPSVIQDPKAFGLNHIINLRGAYVRSFSSRADSSLLDIEVPKTKLSLKSIVDYIRDRFGIGAPPRRVEIELTTAGNDCPDLQATPRLPSDRAGNAGERPLTVVIRLQGEPNRAFVQPFVGTEQDVTLLINNAAAAVVQTLYPIKHAYYLHNQRKSLEAEALLRFTLRSGSKRDAPRIYNALGAIRMDLGDYDGAKALFHKSLDAIPRLQQLIHQFLPGGYGAPLINLGLIEQNSGNLSGAEAQYRRALRSDARDIARLNLGAIALLSGQYDEAAKQFERAIEVNPDEAKAFRDLCEAHTRGGKLEDALADCETAVELDSQNVEAWAWLAAVHRKSGNRDAVSAVLTQAASKVASRRALYSAWVDRLKEEKALDDAVLFYRKQLNNHPDARELELDLASLLLTLNRTGEALIAYAKVAGSDEMSATAKLGSALAYSALGKEDEAEAAYRTATQMDPRNDYALARWAYFEYEHNRFAAADELFERALETDPKSYSAHRLFGVTLESRGKLDKAEDQYLLAAKLRPWSAEIRSDLGDVYRAKGSTTKALAEYRQSASIDPKYEPARIGIGFCLADQGKLDEARRMAREVLKDYPSSANAYALLGLVEIKLRNYRTAIAPLEKAVELNPSHAAAFSNLGWALLNTGDRKRARKMYERALNVEPGMQSALFGLKQLDLTQ